MKNICALLATLNLIYTTAAQETISLEDAQKGARILSQQGGPFTDAPIKMDLDVERPHGLRAESVRMLVIPAIGLSAKTIADAGKDVTPLGQLYLLNIIVAKEGKATPNDKLRLITVNDKNKETIVPVFLLGAKRDKEGKLSLMVYAKDKEPLVQVPLETIDSSQESPIQLEGRKAGEGTGILTLRVLGKYKAELTLMKPAE
jgi:hypothetical protein